MTNGAQPPTAPPPDAPPGAPPPPVAVGGSGLVMLLKILTIVMGVLAVVFIYLMTIGRAETDDTVMGLSTSGLLGIAMAMGAVGMVFGAISVFIGPRKLAQSSAIPPLNALMLGIGTLCLLIGGMFSVMNDGRYAEVTNLGISNLLYILLYAWFMVMFVELGSTSMRYSVVDDYIRKHGITDFSLSPVIGTYFMWFGILMVVIFAWSAAVVVLTPSFLVEVMRNGGNEQLADSVMFNSVYSVAISMAIWFTVMGLILTGVYSFVSDKETEVVEPEQQQY